MWLLEKTFPNGKLYKDSVDPKKKKLEIFLDPTWQVSASSDDCYCIRATTIFLTAAYLRTGYNSGTDEDYDAGMRFTNVHIPKGAVITSAYLTLVAYSSRTASGSVKIKGEASDNAATFTTASDFYARSRTSQYVNWSLPSTSAGTSYDTPDISNIIQEIVNRPGWSPGNALVIFIERDVLGDYREWYSYDGSAGNAPRLTVTFIVQTDDSGEGVDSAEASTLIIGIDTGSGEESVAVSPAIIAIDYAEGEEQAIATAYLYAEDYGVGFDYAQVLSMASAEDSGVGLDAAFTSLIVAGGDVGSGEDLAERLIAIIAEDYGEALDTAEMRNPFIEAINKLLNFIVQFMPLALIAAAVSMVAKIRKPKVAKPPKPEKAVVTEKEIKEAAEALAKRARQR